MADIDFGQLSEALNDKSDRDLRNVDTTAKADAVIDYQEPTADNGYTWYRKYKSGWVEQGVLELSFTTTAKTWTFVIPMADTHYVSMPVKQANNNNNTIVYRNGTTACKYSASAGSAQTGGIYISGMAAN